MKKRIWIFLLLLAAFVFTIGAALTQVIEMLPFEGQWTYNQITESGGNPNDYSFGFLFMNGEYLFYGGHDGMGMWEEGSYTSSTDSIYIELSTSNVPEREGRSFSTKWRIEGYDFILSNATVLTNHIFQEEEIALNAMRTGLENRSWGSIKLEYSD